MKRVLIRSRYWKEADTPIVRAVASTRRFEERFVLRRELCPDIFKFATANRPSQDSGADPNVSLCIVGVDTFSLGHLVSKLIDEVVRKTCVSIEDIACTYRPIESNSLIEERKEYWRDLQDLKW